MTALILLCLASCFSPLPTDRSGNAKHEIALNSASKSKVNYLFKKHSLTQYGTGGSFQGVITSVHYPLRYKNQISQESAKKLFIYISEQLVQIANENRNLRPYFLDYPLTEKNIQVSILFTNVDGKSMYFTYDKNGQLVSEELQ